MRRVLILGGGFGGLTAAHTLRELLPPEVEVMLVDRDPHFVIGFRKTWALVGEGSLEEGRRPLAALEDFGIRFRQGNVTAIDPVSRSAEVEGGRIEADALVIALGAALATERIPGFKDHALNPYSAEAIPAAVEKLREFAGGRVGVGIFGEPYKCPPAPYELAFLLRDSFAARGIEAAMEVFTPKPVSLPLLGDAGCSVIEGRLEDGGIRFLPNHTARAVEDGQVLFETGRRPYDLLFGVPPHRCPTVVVDAGLTGGSGWVEIDRRTMETDYPDVFAVGDVTHIRLSDGKPHPKAGVFAEAQGRVVAQRIAARFEGRDPEAAYEGRGHCFLEVGKGEAMRVQGSFFAEPAPEVALTDPSVDQLADKQAFEHERLARWFGG